MKKILALVLTCIMVCCMFSGCGNDAADKTTNDKESKNANTSNMAEVSTERDPMPHYEKLGVNNKRITADGRYIYYSYEDTTGSDDLLCRRDMDLQNPEELDSGNYYNLYIDEGYLYCSLGRSASRVDIATPPSYFNGSGGYMASEPMITEELSEELWGVYYTTADDEYLYFESSGICRVKKDGTGFETILNEEGRINFYDLKYWNGNLYAYCGDDQMLYRLSPDGSKCEQVCKMMESFVIYEGNAYYIFSGSNHAQQLTKTNLETGETETIAVLGEGWVWADIKNAMDGEIYFVYIDEDDVYTLKAFDIATGDVKAISTLEEETEYVEIVADYIFYEKEDVLMKMNLDGSGIEQIGN